MTSTLTTSPTRRELDHRSSNGIEVTLSWEPSLNDVFVTVHDSAGDSFELRVRPEEALDAFEHPFAYAARRPTAVLVAADSASVVTAR